MAKKQVIVAGLGRFGASMAGTLYQMGHDVRALDTDPRRVQDVMGQVTHPVAADATNEATLRELGVSNFDVAVVAIGSNVEANKLEHLISVCASCHQKEEAEIRRQLPLFTASKGAD